MLIRVPTRTTLFASVIVTLSASLAGPVSADETVSLTCTGNEPFWSLDIDDGNATLTYPGDDEIVEDTYVGVTDDLWYLDPEWIVFRGEQPEDPTKVLVAMARAEDCFDTMADKGPLDYRMVLSWPDQSAAAGCCNPDFGSGE